MLKKNDKIRLEIVDCAATGSGIGRHDGMAVFVNATAPGDVIDAHIIKAKPNYAVAKIENIIEASPMRKQPECPVFLRCGGCVFDHITYEAQAKIKANQVAENLKRIGGLDIVPEPIIAAESTCRYRNKAQYPLEMKDGKLNIGFFSQHSHRVIDCRDCLLAPEEFADILGIFDEYIKKNNVKIYDETAHKGLLRHIYLRKAEMTGEIMVCPVINGNRLPDEEGLVQTLTQKIEGIKSICVNTNTEKTNVILGKKTRTLWGEDCITDILCGLKFRISPLSFYQVNRTQAQKLYEKAAEYAALTGNETVLDLYCGAGTIGLSMAKKAKKIIGVEIVPEAIEDAKINARLNSIDNAEFLCGDASVAAKELQSRGIKPDVLILDPPRKGCAPELVETAVKMAPDRIVYVSCDSATLARDCALFAKLGYTAVNATPVDMFPRTAHIECVVQLSQRKPDAYIDIDLDLDELDITAAESKATYDEIKKYIFKKFGLKVSTLNIAQVKAKHGIIERECYNKGKDGHRVPNCPPKKEDVIVDALRHFKMI